jgi:hypothetical protein
VAQHGLPWVFEKFGPVAHRVWRCCQLHAMLNRAMANGQRTCVCRVCVVCVCCFVQCSLIDAINDVRADVMCVQPWRPCGRGRKLRRFRRSARATSETEPRRAD